MDSALFQYALRLGDTSLILGHRLSEWCGHGPILEEDIAMSNIALDLIGQARMFLTYAGEIEGEGRDEDALAYHRNERDWRNMIIAEQPNGDFAATMTRQFLVAAWQVELYTALTRSTDERVAAIAAKAIKEVTYHRRHAGEWMVRLGDGTEESRTRLLDALVEFWGYTHELFELDAVEADLVARGVTVPAESLKPAWDAAVNAVLAQATVDRPGDGWSIRGGKDGIHSEHLGYLLAEMQSVPRAYPDARW